jgi:hypothetical protein
MRLSALIEQFEAPLLAQYADKLLPEHRQALSAMKTCRSALSPRMQAQCLACEEQVFVPHSCGHRACPHCQHHESQQWLERRLKALVPGEYFLLTPSTGSGQASPCRRNCGPEVSKGPSPISARSMAY